MLNEAETSRPASPPPSHDYDKFNFRPHVLNLLNLIHSDADTVAVSQEVHKHSETLTDPGGSTTTSIS